MNDVECFVETIKGLFENKKKLEDMGKEGKEKIKEFSWNKLIEDYKKLYNVRNNRV